MLDAKGSNTMLSLQKYFIKSKGKNSRVCGAIFNQVDMTPPRVALMEDGSPPAPLAIFSFHVTNLSFLIISDT